MVCIIEANKGYLLLLIITIWIIKCMLRSISVAVCSISVAVGRTISCHDNNDQLNCSEEYQRL